jgi:tetratricopeptide (TPR) repeat protein
VTRVLLISTLCLLALVGAVRADGTTASDYYRRAFHAQTLDARLELLGKALAVNPNHLPSLSLRSELYSRSGKGDLALKDAARAADLAPTDAGLNAAAAAMAERVKAYDRAVIFYNRALARDDRATVVRARQIEALIKLLRSKEAIRSATILVQRRPDLDYPYSIRGDAYESTDMFAEAIRDIEVLIKRHPGEARYYLQRCINRRGLGQGKKALADAERAIRLKSDNPFAYAARGCSYEVLGDYEKALAAYKRAADLRDKDDFYSIWICLTLRKLGRRTEADKFIRGVAKEQKTGKWVAPVIKFLAGEMKEAEVFERAKNKDPQKQREQLCEAYYYIGAAHMAAGRTGRAEELFKKCLALRVHQFYEHGFSIRDLRKIKALRERAAKEAVDKKAPE